MAISAILVKWSGFPSRRSTSMAASVKVMYVPVGKVRSEKAAGTRRIGEQPS